ncbi:hypothetical protein SBA6_230005 [Candidatus Sulfopaludibacter sp. SbA6]|nr:hypothetical protein SBA6_230005 [Candidatus Sulfopaludibacter sp. SbA6]
MTEGVALVTLFANAYKCYTRATCSSVGSAQQYQGSVK